MRTAGWTAPVRNLNNPRVQSGRRRLARALVVAGAAGAAWAAGGRPTAAQIVVRGGAVSSTFTDVDGFTTTPNERREAWGVGAGIAIPVKPWLELFPEAAWVSRGARDIQPHDPEHLILGRVDHRIDVGYLDIALLARAFLGSTESVRAYGAAGPVVAFLATCSVETGVHIPAEARQEPRRGTVDTTFTVVGDCDRPIDPNTVSPFDDVDVGFVLAVGVDVALPFLPGFLNLEGRFARGFQSAFEDNSLPQKNTLYAVTLGYGFHPP